MLLGLDVSTKRIGWTVLDLQGKYVDIGYVNLEKCVRETDRIQKFLDELSFLHSEYELTKVFVEAPLKGSNNLNVVNKLQRWNGMVCCVVYLTTGIESVLLEQRDVLRDMGVIVPKGVKGTDRKKFILQCVKGYDIVPLDKWQKTSKGNPKNFCFDQADSFLVAKAGFLNG